MKKILQILTTSVLIAGVVMLTLPTDPVYAQEQGPPQLNREMQGDRPRPIIPRGPEGLERLYDKLVDKYEDVGYRIHDTDDITLKLEDRIDELNELGEDPSELEAILATFQANMAAVEEAHEAVGVMIDEHAGFNDEGEVEDESLALFTLRQIAEGLLEVHQFEEDARLTLRWDLMVHRYQNQPEE
jgi:hypothetical protein